MCGIAGFVIHPSARRPWSAAVDRLFQSLAHRGPDDHGYLSLGPNGIASGRTPACGNADVLLLHRRLSILDLSPTGHQPMSTDDDRYHIVFNGEIYNYLELRAELSAAGFTFRSTSDTEVLLAGYAHWGHSMLRRLTGMFAFAILDTRARTVFLARDFFGIKPLYYCALEGCLVFASEIKSLLELPAVSRRVNPTSLYEYLTFGVTEADDRTLFRDIQPLPAAHYLHVDLDSKGPPAPRRFWTLDLDRQEDIAFDAAAEKVREVFLENVRLHLRSDVPVGAALSGGIDSSAIVAAMREIGGPDLELHTFTFVARDSTLNEERWADIASAAARTVQHKVVVAADDLARDLDGLIAVQEQPFGSTSIYAQYCLFRLARQVGVKVLLDGQGADEIFGGYRAYLASRLVSLVRQGRLLETARYLHSAFTRRAARPGEMIARAAGMMLPTALHRHGRRLSGHGLTPGYLNWDWFAGHGVSPTPLFQSHRPDALRERLAETLTRSSLPGLLRYEDRNSMAFSIESRVPFLTPQLVELAFRLPEHHIISQAGTTKAVFRQAMRGLVPDAILDRRDKIGFATPERAWLDALAPLATEVLESDFAREFAPLNVPHILKRWRARGTRTKSAEEPSEHWRWINTLRWAQLFSVALS